MTLNWIWTVGWWLAPVLVAFMALWGALVASGASLVRKLPAWPLWAACWWMLVEFGSCRIPFGGFGWTRLAFTTPDQPICGYLGWLGVSGASFACALVSALVAAALLPTEPSVSLASAEPAQRGDADLESSSSQPSLSSRNTQVPQLRQNVANRTTLHRLACALGVAAVLLIGALLPDAYDAPGDFRTINIGVVQGNVDGSAGPRSMGYAGSVLANHYAQTSTLLALARTGEITYPDFILWPENASDLDPYVRPEADTLISASANIAGLPVLVGAVMRGPGEGERQTSALWWVPGTGVVDRVDKRNAVPFGEYTPLRALMFKLFPETQQVGAQTVPGTKPGVIHADSVAGEPLNIGVIICYELAFDDTVRDVVTNGAQVVTVQSNNAGYTGSWQPYQQWQITRVRAMELQREVVVSTTSSLSGLIDANGRVVDVTQEATAAARTYAVPVRSDISWGVRLGPVVEWACAGLALLSGLWALLGSRRRPRAPLESSSDDAGNNVLAP